MDYTRDQISQEVANSWTSLTENTKQIDVAEEACKIAEENLDLNTFSYKEGKLPILDVLSAQLSWIQSYSSLIQTWYQQKRLSPSITRRWVFVACSNRKTPLSQSF